MLEKSFLKNTEFLISNEVREKCQFMEVLFSSSGKSIYSDFRIIQIFTHKFNDNVEKGILGSSQRNLQTGILNAMGLINQIMHYVFSIYCRQNSDFFEKCYQFIDKKFKTQNLFSLDVLLEKFCEEFPPSPVYKKQKTSIKWLNSIDEISGVSNKLIALEELTILKLTHNNPATKDFFVLFSDENLKKINSYNHFWESISKWSKKNAPLTSINGMRINLNNLDILSMLEEPAKHSPYSLPEQLEYIRIYWAKLIPNLIKNILSAKDLIQEEQKAGWYPPLDGFDIQAYSFENLQREYEKFTQDKNWMPNVVLIAKSTLVWLDQLSKKYQTHIYRLDQIPDAELEFFARAGINGLWLIGIWQRSKASQRIKQIYGNYDAAASAYSLYDYEIAEELGGWESLAHLREKALKYGIRLAADMVPNHTGLDSKWVMEKPQLFLQCKHSPFPSYNFDGENLSQDNRTDVYLENGYYRKDDCAVVFKRRDNFTGDETYIYHGNDGTGLPWNDTAQIDFLNPEAREAVMQKILHVAGNFPIIRFDAAMVLAKKHIRRLWYPEPGRGGDIASRSNYSLNLEEFENLIPNEFWREVVDRCANEAPDTLLLAEAFWMMEGYFVRTLGMHRVYNSAFMNMLKKEENSKYRLTIKNTLEFDPEILKRFVNFMNNPDEETAIAQFGDGDKYFGVCTMMSAMPGLPMFGHGQLEGFEEKYGMEFKRASRYESVKDWVIERHRREIFPLLHKRYIFSGVENFKLFDFWNNGEVNENVFAWSNYLGEEKALIFYNNAYERVHGWIKTSSTYAVKNNLGKKFLKQDGLIYALNLQPNKNYFTIMQEQKSELYFLRNNFDLAEHGFFAMLNGYETQVFMNIKEIEDKNNSYSILFEKLNGRGVKNIDIEIQKIEYKDCYLKLHQFIEKYLPEIESIKHKKNTKQEVSNFFTKNKTEIKEMFAIIYDAINTNISINKEETVDKAISALKIGFSNLLTLYKIVNEEKCLHKPEPNLLDGSIFIANVRKEFNKKTFLTYLSAVVFIALNQILGKKDINNLNLETLLGETLATVYGTEIDENTTREILNLFKSFETTNISTKDKIKTIFKKTFPNKNIRDYLLVHQWENAEWFNKERAENFALKILVYLTVKESEQKKDILQFCQLYDKFIKIISSSQYKSQNLME